MKIFGAAAELQSGKAWVNLFAEEILDPMGMSPDLTYWTYPNNPWLSGGLNTSVLEYQKLLKGVSDSLFAESGGLLERTIAQELLKPRVNSSVEVRLGLSQQGSMPMALEVGSKAVPQVRPLAQQKTSV